MAQIQKREGKRGISYKITVTKGTTPDGKKIRHYKRWTPPEGMSAIKAQKEVQKIA